MLVGIGMKQLAMELGIGDLGLGFVRGSTLGRYWYERRYEMHTWLIADG